MARLRRQLSVARMCAAVLPVALAFAWLRPWQAALSLSVGMLIPIFVSGLTGAEAASILANAAVISALMMPGVSTKCWRGTRIKAPARAVVARIPVPDPQP